MPLIDSHCHLADDAFGDDRDAVIARAKEAGLSAIVNISTDAKTLLEGVAIRMQYPWVYLTAATTPHDVATDGEEFFPLVEQYSHHLVAIGETGLDYHYQHSPRDLQKQFLRRYLDLAHRCNLPVVIHCRDAFEDFFRILDEGPPVPGVLHCFTGTLEEAREVVARNWYVSLSGIATFKKNDALREAAREIPLDHLLIETDAPYLAPQSHRGKRNEPAFIVEVAQTIADVKEISIDQVRTVTSTNARSLFKID
jgi:TatD DNase family protein